MRYTGGMKRFLTWLSFAVPIMLIAVMIGYGWYYSQKNPQGVPAVQASGVFNPAAQTKSSGCAVNGRYPDPACTPGAAIAGVTADQVCTPGYASSVRNVPTAEKGRIYAEYGIASHAAGQYEIDHFVSLELGGSNDPSNLWPEAASPKPGFHEKDQVENYLHDRVCANGMSLAEAQREIATDWYAVYLKIAR